MNANIIKIILIRPRVFCTCAMFCAGCVRKSATRQFNFVKARPILGGGGAAPGRKSRVVCKLYIVSRSAYVNIIRVHSTVVRWCLDDKTPQA